MGFAGGTFVEVEMVHHLVARHGCGGFAIGAFFELFRYCSWELVDVDQGWSCLSGVAGWCSLWLVHLILGGVLR